jgi:ABC-type glycerol-3-phosphate transport system substrate-binding protein
VVAVNSDRSQSAYLDTILPNFLDAGRRGDQLFAVPYALGTPLLYYNKSLYRQAGLDPEAGPKTMDDVVAAAKVVQDKTGIAGFGHIGGIDSKFFGTALIARNAGGRYLNEDGDRVILDSPQAMAGLQFWQDISVKHKIMPIVANDAGWRTAFLAGKLAHYVDSSALISQAVLSSAGNFELGAVSYPIFPGRAERAVVNSGGLFMMFSPPGPRRDASVKFLEFITRLEIQGYWSRSTGYMPVIRDAMRSKELQAFVAEVPHAAPMIVQMPDTQAVDGWTSPKNPAAAAIIGTLIDDLWANKGTVPDLVPDAVKRANAALV